MSRLLALLVCLLVLPAFAQEEMPEVARSLMEEAATARDAQRDDEAISKYARVIQVAPSLASAYVNLGALYFKQGKVDKAYAVFAKGVENAPADRTLLSNAAATAQQLGKPAEALKYVDRAIDRNKRDGGLYSLRGSILRALGRNDEALASLQQAAQVSPDDAKVQFSLGNQLYQMGHKEEAITAYGRASAIDHTFLRAYYNLGAVLFETGRDDDALESYRVALAPAEQSFAKGEPVDPINARAYANLGAIHLKQKQWQPAIDAYVKSLRLDPKNTNAHYNLGFIYFTTNRPQAAEEEYRKALAADATLPLAYLHLGELAFRRSEYDQTAQLLREGLPHFDSASRLAALKMLARAELARGKRAEALEALRQTGDDVESMLLLGHILRQDGKLAEAKNALERARSLAPDSSTVTFERLLLARTTNDAAVERAAIEELLTKEPERAAPLRAELGAILVRQGDLAAARTQGALNGPLVAAVTAALDGQRDAAARSLAELATPMARGDAGLLLWQLGRFADARPHLAAAHAAFGDWNEVKLAAGEIAFTEHRYEEAVTLLSAVKCDAPPFSGALAFTLGRNDDLCGRTKSALANGLLARAAELLAEGSPRQARALLEHAADRAAAVYLRGRAELALGNEDGRDSIARAVSLGLPGSLEGPARRDLDVIEHAMPDAPADPASTTPRRKVAVFLPDVPAENEKKLADAMNALVAQWSAAARVPLEVELFRRADDARNFILGNRDKVGVVIANPEFARSLDFVPKFQFTHEGTPTYRRVVVVRAKSSERSLADLKGKTISAAGGLGDAGVTVTTRVPDDLTALANALYGKTNAALVNEANHLLAQHASELRIVHTTQPLPLPVYAFGALLPADRNALYESLGNRGPLQMGVARLERAEHKRELSPLSVASLGLPKLADPPQNVALRVTVELPQIVIPEDLFGKP